MPAAYVSGVGQTPFGKSDRSLLAMLVDASSLALVDAGADAVDAVGVGTQTAEDLSGASNLGT